MRKMLLSLATVLGLGFAASTAHALPLSDAVDGMSPPVFLPLAAAVLAGIAVLMAVAGRMPFTTAPMAACIAANLARRSLARLPVHI